jgi:divalent metal cation (Fe/Co/Zn/Cd) transporter
MKIDEAHDICTCIENEVYENLGFVSTIHIEPRK